jgi:hypothetical protein
MTCVAAKRVRPHRKQLILSALYRYGMARFGTGRAISLPSPGTAGILPAFSCAGGPPAFPRRREGTRGAKKLRLSAGAWS